MNSTPEQRRWQLVESIFHQMEACPAHLRAARLREICAGDDALAREVESLLDCSERLRAASNPPARSAP